MEENKSNIDILKEYTENSDRKIFWTEEQYPLSGYRQFPKYRRTVYIPNKDNNSVFYVLFSDPYQKIGEHTIFCGAFMPLPFKIKGKLSVRRKNIVDKLSFVKKRYKTDFLSNRFLAKTILDYEYESDVRQLLHSVLMQERILETLGKSFINVISINEYNTDFVPELEGKSCLGIVNPQSWELNDSEIEKYFSLAEKIRKLI